ncbi:MAG TPA: anti-sigma F factor [Clostridiales bacterium]|nr:anti-sigma F factor [Clostridiales bacterium]HPV02552.1 anti-sigma F factor [Clostridiales bacterium]
MQPVNEMKLEFLSKSSNEAFARVVAAAFVSQLDPTIEELADVRTAVSEAVTNAIIHGYENETGIITMVCRLYDKSVEIEITDNGKGIEDIELAMQPLYTSKPEMERSGMGFTVMESFMDRVKVRSKPGEGTTVTLYKTFGSGERAGKNQDK